jgi:predicted PhzF superfamily epimerase YddE/YHI9
MTKSGGTQTYYSKSLSTKEFKLFNSLDLYLIELPEIWDEIQISNTVDAYDVSKDRDYVFYQQRINTFFVRFKNLGGEFSLCGSGILALAKHLFSTKKLDGKYISFRTISDRFLKAKLVDEIVSLEIVKTPMTQINQNTWLSNSGVYIQELSKPELKKLTIEDAKRFPKINNLNHLIGGYCAFSRNNDILHLRYFTPWHGRNEDYATLSIFEHLSDLLEPGKYTIYQNEHQFSCIVGESSISIF